MFLFCFAHGKFTLISHNSALPALVSLIRNLVELSLKTAKKCHIGKPTKKLKNKRDLTQIAKPNSALPLKAANLFSRLKPMIKGQYIYNLHHFLASNQKTLLTKLPRLALSLEFSKLGLAISLIQTLTLERGGCSAQLRQGLPVLLSPTLDTLN